MFGSGSWISLIVYGAVEMAGAALFAVSLIGAMVNPMLSHSRSPTGIYRALAIALVVFVVLPLAGAVTKFVCAYKVRHNSLAALLTGMIVTASQFAGAVTITVMFVRVILRSKSAAASRPLVLVAAVTLAIAIAWAMHFGILLHAWLRDRKARRLAGLR